MDTYPFDDPAEVEVWPTYTWWSDTTYHVSISAGAFADGSLLEYAGMHRGISFKTTNTIAPVISGVNATVTSGNVATITLTWLSLGPIQKGVASVTIVDVRNNASAATVLVGDTSVVSFPALAAGETVSHEGNYYDARIALKTALPGPATYAVRWADSAFRDGYSNGVLPEKSNRWTFTTPATLSKCDIDAKVCQFPVIDAVEAKEFVSARVTLAGTVDDFTDARLSSMKTQIAGQMGVNAQNVEISISGASVLLTIVVGYADATAAASGRALLNNKVTSTSAAATFLSTPSFPATVEAVQPAASGRQSAKGSGLGGGALAGIAIGAVVVLLLVAFFAYRCRKGAATPSAVPQQKQAYSTPSASSVAPHM